MKRGIRCQSLAVPHDAGAEPALPNTAESVVISTIRTSEQPAYQSFAVYSGRYEADGRAPVYDNGASMSEPVVADAPWLFLDLVSGGLVSTSNVSIYLRIYADGHATYLGPADRFRAMPTCAVNRWNYHARQYGLPEIKRDFRAVA